MSTLRARVIQAAYTHPELRAHLLPLLKVGSVSARVLAHPAVEEFKRLMERDREIEPNLHERLDAMAVSRYNKNDWSVPVDLKDAFEDTTIFDKDWSPVTKRALKDLLEVDFGVPENTVFDSIDSVIWAYLGGKISPGDIQEIFEDVRREKEEEAFEDQDPYGYRGLSRHDF